MGFQLLCMQVDEAALKVGASFLANAATAYLKEAVMALPSRNRLQIIPSAMQLPHQLQLPNLPVRYKTLQEGCGEMIYEFAINLSILNSTLRLHGFVP
eukprot:363868-Chlamydomonas_euryale.AAC.2